MEDGGRADFEDFEVAATHSAEEGGHGEGMVGGCVGEWKRVQVKCDTSIAGLATDDDLDVLR